MSNIPPMYEAQKVQPISSPATQIAQPAQVMQSTQGMQITQAVPPATPVSTSSLRRLCEQSKVGKSVVSGGMGAAPNVPVNNNQQTESITADFSDSAWEWINATT